MNQQPLLLNGPTPAPASTLGRERLAGLVKHLIDNPITDVVLDGKDIGFSVQHAVLCLHKEHKQGESVHAHAVGQICDRVHIPRRYVQNLLAEGAEWSDDLLMENLELLFRNRGKDKAYLIRSVNSQVRGFLSNAYGRLDTTSLIETFSAACSKASAEPYDAFMTDLHICVQGALPNLFAVKDRSIKVGVSLKHSDFGAGALAVNLFIGDGGYSLISRRGIRRIHKGRRLVTGSAVRTAYIVEEDTNKAAERIPPLVQDHLNKESLAATMAELDLSMSTTIDPDKVADILQSLHLTDIEMTHGVDAFRNRSELPDSYTRYRLACTIAWLADTETNMARKLELMETAGDLILPEK